MLKASALDIERCTSGQVQIIIVIVDCSFDLDVQGIISTMSGETGVSDGV